MEPTELINPDAQHCGASEVTHLKDKGLLKDDVNGDLFCGMICNRLNNPGKPDAVKCWTTATNRSKTFPLWF